MAILQKGVVEVKLKLDWIHSFYLLLITIKYRQYVYDYYIVLLPIIKNTI